VLGGAVGEAVLGKKVGNKAILWGAIGGTIPDLDTIPGQFMDTVDRLAIHRGFSHSIVFAILIAPLLGYLINRLYKGKQADFKGWTALFFWTIFTHPLLDIFTTWGTQLFWPLEWRIALHSIFVIDPLYTLPFLLCLIVLMFYKRKSKWRRKINLFGIYLSSLYLVWSLIAKIWVGDKVEQILRKDGIDWQSYQSRPGIFNTILWTFNIEQKDRFLITYYSFLDKDDELLIHEFPKNHHLLNPYRNHKDIEKLIFLTKGYFIIEAVEDGLLMHDLRFGLTEGFTSEVGDFVFTYKIQEKDGDLFIEQVQQSFRGMEDVLKKNYQRMLGLKFV
jgi:inner membrane protein